MRAAGLRRPGSTSCAPARSPRASSAAWCGCADRAPVLLGRRGPPPALSVARAPLRPLQQHRDALAAADACGGDAPGLAALRELEQERVDEPGAGGAQRVAERDRAAVHVHPLAVEPQLLLDREELARERLVDLEEIH